MSFFFFLLHSATHIQNESVTDFWVATHQLKNAGVDSFAQDRQVFNTYPETVVQTGPQRQNTA